MTDNTDYLYEHLPARFRRADEGLFLKRLLTFAGDTLDAWDNALDAFWQRIHPSTASAEFVVWWLYSLFGWSWFPRWFTLANKRTLYANFARHLARRGTRRGIELWLLDFGVVARVAARPRAYDDDFYGEGGWLVDEPLVLVVEILGYQDYLNVDRYAYGDSFYHEAYYTPAEELWTRGEIEALLRYVWPVGQEMFVVWAAHPPYTEITPAAPVAPSSLQTEDGNGLVTEGDDNLITE
jgi:phage tail-like protein